jgi:hypothetical protein
VAASPALAAGRSARDGAAKKACLIGDYAKGIEILADLFVETEDPIYVFNQGRCLEQNQQYKDAIARFQEYLRIGETHALKAADEAAAKKHITTCKEILAEQPVEARPPAAPAPFTAPAPVPAPASAPLPATVASPGTSVAQPDVLPEPATAGSRLRVAGIVTAAVGVAALGAGVAFNVLANNTVGDMESSLNGYANKNSTHDTYVTLAWVGYGVGAACVVAGAISYGFGFKAKSASSTNLALVPTVGQGAAGASLLGAF